MKKRIKAYRFRIRLETSFFPAEKNRFQPDSHEEEDLKKSHTDRKENEGEGGGGGEKKKC